MGLLETLTTEIERVVSAPYAVSLKRLHDILMECDSPVVHAWADASICQVAPLARCVKEALQIWPFALEVLQRLARARPYRDAFLQQDPSILDAFLRKATLSELSSDVYRVCVVLLSEPLPQDVPLPLSAQEFFMKSFDRAAKSMEEQHVSIIHSLLHGACRSLLGVLPQDKIEYIEEKAYKLLENFAGKKTGDGERYGLPILCLGLMGILTPSYKIQSRQVLPGYASNAENPFLLPQWPSTADNYEETPRLFQGSKARATIRLTVTISTFLLNTTPEEVDETTVSYLRIVGRILAVVPRDARHEYLDREAHFVSKLIEKALKASNHPGVQLQGLVCIGLLHEGRRLPGHLVSAYSKALLSARHVSQDYQAFAEAVSLSFPCFAEQLGEDFVKEVLCSAVQATIQSTSRVSELQWLYLLIKLFGEVAQDWPDIRRSILLTVSSDSFREYLRKLQSFRPSEMAISREHGGMCRHTALDSATQLGLGICSLLLRAALIAQVDELGMDAELGLLLLQKQQELAAFHIFPCEHSRPRQDNPAKLSLVQETCTPYSQSDSRGWRARLEKEIEFQDKQRIELIERRVGEVCRDLEARCEQVEEPLRLEQRKVQTLQEEIRMLREQYNELCEHATNLETREVDRELFMEGLEAEKTEAEKELALATEANDALAKKAEDLQRKLDEANETAERTLTSAREEYDRMVLDLRALLSKEETRCEEQAAAVDNLKVQVADIENQLMSSQNSLLQEQKNGEYLKEALDGAEQQIEEQKTAKLQAQAEVSDLLEKESALIDQLRQTHAALEECSRNAAELKIEHEGVVVSLHADIESLRRSAEAELHRVEEEASKAHQDMESRIETAQHEISNLIDDKEALTSELRARDSHILRMQRKLEKICETRDSAVARAEELEAWRNSIWTAMGAPTAGANNRTTSQIGGIISGHLGRRRTFAESEIDADRDLVEDPDRTESERTQSPRDGMESQRSVSASPTPKRARVQRQQPFKPPTLKTRKSTPTDARRRSTRLSQGRRDSTATRKPLQDVSSERGNASPMRRSAGAKTVSFGNVPGSSAKGTHQDEQLTGSFDLSEYMAGTPLTPSGRRRLEESNVGSGDTTIDL